MPLTYTDPVAGSSAWDVTLNAILDAIKTWSQAPDAVTTPGAAVQSNPNLLDGSSGSGPGLGFFDHVHQTPGGLGSKTANQTISSNNAETTILSIAGLPLNYLGVGTVLRFKARGTVQVQAGSGTLTFKVYLGNVLNASLQMPNQAGAAGPVAWEMEYTVTVQSNGAGGTMLGGGRLSINWATFLNVLADSAGTNAVDTTAAQIPKITAQWATSSATNILVITQASVEVVQM